jgi:hypothetical protein
MSIVLSAEGQLLLIETEKSTLQSTGAVSEFQK